MVTGASTGIGEQVAYHYARSNAQIVITARREHVLQQVSAFYKNTFSSEMHFYDTLWNKFMELAESSVHSPLTTLPGKFLFSIIDL